VQRRIVWCITFVGGLFFLLEFLLPDPAPTWLGGFRNPLTPYLPPATTFVVVVGAMAFLLGPLNLLRSHVGTAFRRRKGWVESVVFLVFLVVGIVAAACHQEAAEKVAGVQAALETLYNAVFYGILTSFFASSMALLAFYLVSAAHRSLRVNNAEAAVMMASAAVLLLGQVPLGDWITQWLPESLQLRAGAQWILAVPNAGVQRAVLIGACGGAFAAGFRHWLGIGAKAR
jgi:hypothetical protein